MAIMMENAPEWALMPLSFLRRYRDPDCPEWGRRADPDHAEVLQHDGPQHGGGGGPEAD